MSSFASALAARGRTENKSTSSDSSAFLQPATERQPLLGTSKDNEEASFFHSCCSGPILVRILTCVTSLADGYDISVISGAVVIFAKEFQLSKIQVGLIISVVYFAIAAGSLVAGSLMNCVGRKMSLCISYSTLFAGSLIMGFGNSFSVLFAGRVAVGIGIGGGLVTVSTYIAEVAPAHHRGLYSSAEEVFIVLGMLCGYLANYMLLGIKHDWRWMLALGAVVPFTFTLLLLTPLFPESPRYLLLKGKTDEAKQVLERLVNQDEAEQVMLQWKESKLGDSGSWAQVLCPEGSAKTRAMLAGVAVGASQLMTGIPIVSICSSMVLEEEIGTEQAFFQVTMVGAARVIFAALVTIFLVDHWGRRPLLLASSCGLVFCSGYLAVAFHINMLAIPWKLLGLYMFVLFYSIGLGPVVYTYIGEVFDSNVRGHAVGMAATIGRIFAGVLLLCFPVLSENIGIGGVFYILVFVNVIIASILFVVVRETRQIPLESIWKAFATPRSTPPFSPKNLPTPPLSPSIA